MELDPEFKAAEGSYQYQNLEIQFYITLFKFVVDISPLLVVDYGVISIHCI